MKFKIISFIFLSQTLTSGLVPKIVRPPQGKTTLQINKAIEDHLRMKIILWSVDSGGKRNRSLGHSGPSSSQSQSRSLSQSQGQGLGVGQSQGVGVSERQGVGVSVSQGVGQGRNLGSVEVGQRLSQSQSRTQDQTQILRELGGGNVTSAKTMISNVIDKVTVGDIVHFRESDANLLESLPVIIDTLHKKGFELLTVSEMLSYPDDAPH